MKNNFYFSQKFFASPGIVRQSMERLGSDPSLAPIRVQTLAKKFFKLIKIISTVIV